MGINYHHPCANAFRVWKGNKIFSFLEGDSYIHTPHTHLQAKTTWIQSLPSDFSSPTALHMESGCISIVEPTTCPYLCKSFTPVAFLQIQTWSNVLPELGPRGAQTPSITPRDIMEPLEGPAKCLQVEGDGSTCSIHFPPPLWSV